ncbi:23S rRNA (uracil(747)-C(5))-methyltransferase RlmC [Demequina activiva]|uniref:23S rRNA (Uracil(747)-C(5))-methyltransferase n=1 Tax=Demequina activiva TaxID=1582364 RepID=A0A919UIR5_9MICO|nr:23S rRNA (uracil(747)-C(5))-methyltransferase RlmC [Demequina activiva]GIG53636.1 23S rRNA (uracil(747)-C(5))-methyltransferase [Demequina activiva]
MRCDYYAAGLCRSCTIIEQPYAEQVADKQARVADLLGPLAPGLTWLPPVTSDEAGFRTKAKMVIAGTVQAPTIGILDASGRGQDLRDCPLYPVSLSRAFPMLADFVTRAGLEPYDVPGRRGELKHVLVTVAPDEALMVRWVLRSTEALARIRKHLPWLLDQLPDIAVASVNVQPAHAAVLEGEREVVLTERETLTMRVNGIDLHLRPQSFFQTNTAVASALYRQAAAWIEASAPASLWDLYCGVGGFALHGAAPGRTVTGVETSAQAVASAQRSRDERLWSGDGSMRDVAFETADAVAWATGQASSADAIVVNPPRRGLGEELSRWLDASGASTVIYSSCNPDTLARDLAWMPSLVAREARLFDMFPHTGHGEVGVVLERA